MRLVRNPVFSADDHRFLFYFEQNRRLFAILDMIGAYQALRAEAKGETTAEVASAEPLSISQVQALKDELAQLSDGRSV